MERVLVVVQNLPLPLDRRVWLECLALRDAGYHVSAICPQGPGDPAYEELDGVHLYKYTPSPAAAGALGYVREFVECWLRTARLSVRVRREQGFDVLQACNPPDTYWVLARLWRRAGVRFVFDQHDLNPELFRSRFGEPRTAAARLQLALLHLLERMSYRTADHVITVNESYRDVVLRRGRRSPEDVTVVRSGPDTRRMRPVQVVREPGDERRVIAYLGIMGPQDGVDLLVDAMDVLVHEMGREDVHLVAMGFGDCLEALREQSHRLGLDENITFTGRVDAPAIAQHLSRAELGVGPDPSNPLNDVSTMNKTMEYMAFALPVVTFDLTETRVSAGDAACYVPAGDVRALARAVSDLLDDPPRRARMAEAGRRRAVEVLDWAPQSAAYVRVFDRLLRRAESPVPCPGGSGPAVVGGEDAPVLLDPRVEELAAAPRGRSSLVPVGQREAPLEESTGTAEAPLVRAAGSRAPGEGPAWRRR